MYARPHAWADSRRVARNPPEGVALATVRLGPVGVSTVTTTRSPGANAAPRTTSGTWRTSSRVGPDTAAAAEAKATRVTAVQTSNRPLTRESVAPGA